MEPLAAPRSASTGLPPLEVDEEVRLQQAGVELFLTDPSDGRAEEEDGGAGTLVITTRSVLWLSALEGKGYRVAFPTISLHAISRGATPLPLPLAPATG